MASSRAASEAFGGLGKLSRASWIKLMYICIYTDIDDIYTRTCICMYEYIYIYTYIHIHIHTHIYIYTHEYAHAHTFVSMCVRTF